MSIIAGVAAFLIVGLAGTVRLYMSRAAEDRLYPGDDVAIAELRPPLPENGFLACPPGHCAAAGAAAPVFDLPAAELRACWQRAIAGEHRVVAVAADPARSRFVYIQHTLLLRFPDIVTVEVVALAPAQSSVAIYSRARYGRFDFGTNRRRVARWLARLAATARGGPC